MRAKDESEIDVIEDEPEIEIPKEYASRESFLSSVSTENNPIEDIRWVFHALGAKDLKPEDAPSTGAWNLLQTLKYNEIALNQFYTTVYPKLLPTRAQLEKGENNRAEDGRKQFDLIDQILREPDTVAPILSHTEKRARKLAVSQKGS
jgi:hypothetical protein